MANYNDEMMNFNCKCVLILKYELNLIYNASKICPDYDKDCVKMNGVNATWCFMGCPNHECLPIPNSLGIAEGYCPIIHNLN